MTEALLGGVFIGIAVSIMLIFNGRVTGISGIISGVLKPLKGDVSWRISFILGLLAGGLVLRIYFPHFFVLKTQAAWFDYLIRQWLHLRSWSLRNF